MNDLIMIKLGGSIITHKEKAFSENKNAIKRLAEEIHEARKEKNFLLIVGHGGGSYPHRPASEYKTAEGMVNEKSVEGIAKVQDAASRLNRIIISSLIKEGENAVSIQPSASCVAENSRVVEWFTKPIELMLEKNIIPVPYGDVALDTEKGCCILSTEELIDFLSLKLKPSKVIIAGNVNGVMKNYGKGNAEIITKITPKNFKEVKKHIGGSSAVDVTGGMLHKVEKMLELAERGIESQIINAEAPGRLKEALLGKKVVGTTIMKE